MEKTINQWLDEISKMPDEFRASDDIITFKRKLLELKGKDQNTPFGGLIKIILPVKLEEYFKK